MIIDNFEQINKLLRYESDDTFYFLEILKRRKENPNLERDVKLIKTFYLKEHELLKKKVEIKEYCEKHNARAYIRINSRSFKKVGMYALVKLSNYIKDNEFQAIKRLYDHSCGKQKNSKIWIVDVDTKIPDHVNQIMHYIRLCCNTNATMAQIPTLNGYHIITMPFNTKNFEYHLINKTYKDIVCIHKDNPTLLYYNDLKK